MECKTHGYIVLPPCWLCEKEKARLELLEKIEKEFLEFDDRKLFVSMPLTRIRHWKKLKEEAKND